MASARATEPPDDDQYWSRPENLRGPYLRPTAEQRTEFAERLDVYQANVEYWLQQIEDFLAKRSMILEAEILQTSDSSVPAKEAEVELLFPQGFEPVEDLPSPPDLPKPPDFPYKLSPSEVFRRSTRFAERGIDYPISRSSLLGLEPAFSLWAPSYQYTRDGLVASYKRQTIQHRINESTGDPFQVRAPGAGKWRVGWSVHAENLPTQARGELIIRAVTEPSGEPMSSLPELLLELRRLNPEEEE